MSQQKLMNRPGAGSSPAGPTNKLIKRTALYGRVSMEEAARLDHGSLEQQGHMGRTLAKQLSERSEYEYVITHELIEDHGVSWGNTNRPEFQKMMALVRTKKIDAIVAKEVSRICRNTRDFCEFLDVCRDHEVEVHIKDLPADPNTINGRMQFQLMATFAEMEREQTRKRVRESARSALKHNGKINGGSIPLGFDPHPDKKGFLIPNKLELSQVEELMRFYLDTGSLKATVDHAQKIGIKNKRGRPLSISTLKHLLQNPKYIGIAYLQPDAGRNYSASGRSDTGRNGICPGQPDVCHLPHGEVIDKDLFDRVQTKVKAHNSRRNLLRKNNRVYLLSGLIFHFDQLPYSAVSGTGSCGSKRYYYRNHFHKISLDAIALEKAVIDVLVSYLKSDSELEKSLSSYKVEKTTQLAFINQQIKSTELKFKKLETDKKKITAKILEDETELTSKWLGDQIASFNQTQSELNEQLSSIKAERLKILMHEVDPRAFKSRLEYILYNFQKSDPIRQKEFLRSILSKVVILDDTQAQIKWSLGQEIGLITVGGGMLCINREGQRNFSRIWVARLKPMEKNLCPKRRLPVFYCCRN